MICPIKSYYLTDNILHKGVTGISTRSSISVPIAGEHAPKGGRRGGGGARHHKN